MKKILINFSFFIFLKFTFFKNSKFLKNYGESFYIHSGILILNLKKSENKTNNITTIKMSSLVTNALLARSGLWGSYVPHSSYAVANTLRRS